MRLKFNFYYRFLWQILVNTKCIIHRGIFNKEWTCSVRVQVFSFKQILVILSAHTNKHFDWQYILVKIIESKLSPYDQRNTQAWFFGQVEGFFFSTAFSGILFPGCVEKTTFCHQQFQTSLNYSKDLKINGKPTLLLFRG